MIILVLLFLCIHRVNTSCNETLSCSTTDGQQGICFMGACMTSLPYKARENLEFSIKVRYPQEQLQNNGGKSLYIRGSGMGLSWSKGKVIQVESANNWRFTIKYKSSTDGFRCHDCSDTTTITKQFEYRILIDDKKDMLGGNFAVKLPVSMTSSYFNAPVFEAFPWFHTENGTVSNFTITSPEIGEQRKIALYLPPSFNENTHKHYPKIFVFDILPAYMQLLKTSLDHLLSRLGTTKEFVLIGFGDYRYNERTDLLTPIPGSFLGCINGTLEDNCDGCLPVNVSQEALLKALLDKCGKKDDIAGFGEKTLDFLLNTVLPETEKITTNRLLTERRNTGIMGYSLGGLMSCHAAWTRSADFGMAACQSPSLFWPMNNTSLNECDFHFLNVTLKNPALMAQRFPQKILIDAGSIENLDPFRLTQSSIEAATEMTKTPYFELNKNLWLNIYPDSPHSMNEWAFRYWTVLQALLPSDGHPHMPIDSSHQDNGVANKGSNCYSYVLVLFVATCILFKSLIIL